MAGSIQTFTKALKDGRRVKRFRAAYRDSLGHQVAKVFGPGTGNGDAKRDAQHWLDVQTANRLSGREVDRRAGRQTFGELWDEVHAEAGYARATEDLHQFVRDRYLRALEGVRIADVTRAAVARVLKAVPRDGMREKVRLVLSAVLGHAVDAGSIPANPARKLRASRTRSSRASRNGGRHRRLTRDDLQRLIEAVPARYRALVQVMAYVGLRPGEAYALTVGQVGPVLTIDRAAGPEGKTKTGETREIPLPKVVHELLEEHKVGYSDPTDPEALMFTTEEGKPVRKDSFRNLLTRACRKAAIEPVAPNDLRHTAAAFAIAQGFSVYVVQRMLGHARPSITLDVYGYLWDTSMEDAAVQLDAALRLVSTR